MKQYITLKQWDEITKEQKNILWDSGFKRDWKMNIIQMIEYLGDDLLCIEPYALGNESKTCNGWSVSIKQMDVFAKPRSRKGSCMCDALWKAVKYKLTQ